MALAAAVLVFGALLVAPAFGIHLPVIDFFHGEQATPHIVRDFSTLSSGAPPGMDPGVIAGETRRVETASVGGRAYTLWVAPTRSGGLCYEWTDFGGGCDRLGTTPLDVVWAGTEMISVHVSAAYVDRVEIRFADGTTAQPEIAWVSAPINAGFFLYAFNAEQQQPGHEVSSVVALDKDGNVVTEQTTPGRPEKPAVPPPDALISQKTDAFSAPTPHGDAVIWQAPTRYEGKCAWLEFEGKLAPIAPCQPKGYDWNEGLISGFYPTADAVLFFGTAADRYQQIALVYQDGDTTSITPRNHVFVVAIPDEHFQPGHQVERIEARGPDGGLILSAPFSPGHEGTAGCSQVVPVSLGDQCSG
jgi:hypothetical protein